MKILWTNFLSQLMGLHFNQKVEDHHAQDQKTHYTRLLQKKGCQIYMVRETSRSMTKLVSDKVHLFEVEKILKYSLGSIPSPSPSVKTQIMGGKVCLRCKGKTLLGVVNQLLKAKSLLTLPSNAMFCPITSSKFSRQ